MLAAGFFFASAVALAACCALAGAPAAGLALAGGFALAVAFAPCLALAALALASVIEAFTTLTPCIAGLGGEVCGKLARSAAAPGGSTTQGSGGLCGLSWLLRNELPPLGGGGGVRSGGPAAFASGPAALAPGVHVGSGLESMSILMHKRFVGVAAGMANWAVVVICSTWGSGSPAALGLRSCVTSISLRSLSSGCPLLPSEALLFRMATRVQVSLMSSA